MSRHRGVRNRQFSYDEADGDYYDEEEDAEYEEYRQHSKLSSREKDAEGGSGIPLSSYFDLPSTTQKQKQQQQREGLSGARRQPRFPDSHPPAHAEAADGELVEAVGTELERRLGRDRFTPLQIRQAVVSSGYEVDTAEAILRSSDQSRTMVLPSVHVDSSKAGGGVEAAAAGGLPPAIVGRTAESAPSLLAFGLSVDGQGESRRKGFSALPGFGSAGLPYSVGAAESLSSGAAAAASAAPAGGTSVFPYGPARTGVQPFGFDTPSPDDINLNKQAGARRGGGVKTNGDGSANADYTVFSSPKAKVVHISGLTPQGGGGRKSLSSGRSGRKEPATTPTSANARARSPTAGAKLTSPQPVQASAEEILEEDGGKERLAMVVIGHVDAGKSTLMGQLLVQVGQVSQRALHKQEKEAREAGKASFFLAWVMDEDQEERTHGVTIDVAQKYVETETKLVTVLDAPGHRDFIPKMISGTSAADAALLVIPATVGEFESGFQESGQTKEHAMLAKALGVNQVVVVVNKLDAADPPWSKERYESVKAEVGPFLGRTGFRPKKVRFVPASGLSGENVSKRDPAGPLSAWYDGPTLLEAINAFSPAPNAADKPFRMCVADVSSSGKGVSVSGRVVRGRVRASDKVFVMPLEDPASVTRLERNGVPVRGARAGDNAEITLSGVDAARVVVGNVLCKAGGTVPVVQRFSAQIVALPALEVPIIKGTEFQMHMHNLDVMVHCSKLVSLTNSAGEVLKTHPRCVPSGSTAHIRITSSRPLCLEKYSDCRALGRFVLRQTGSTVAVGLVLDTEAR